MSSNYFRPLATKFNTRTKKRQQTLTESIAHFAEEPAIPAAGDKVLAYKCKGTRIHTDGTVVWGDELDTDLINYITRYLQQDEGIEGKKITAFPVTITIEDTHLSLEREWWAGRHVKNIERILTAKQTLLAQALGINTELVLPTREGSKLIFHWLTDTTSDELRASLPQLLGGGSCVCGNQPQTSSLLESNRQPTVCDALLADAFGFQRTRAPQSARCLRQKPDGFCRLPHHRR